MAFRGKPATKVRVFAETSSGRAYRARTSSDGRFTLKVPAKNYKVYANPGSYNAYVADGATTTAMIRFETSHTVAGTVKHRGKGVAGMWVPLQREYPLSDLTATTGAVTR